MSQFYSSFCLTLIHSLWQSAILLLIAILISAFYKELSPSVKKIAFSLLMVTQVILSCLTFIVIFTEGFSTLNFVGISFVSMLDPTWFYQHSDWIFGTYIAAFLYKVLSISTKWYGLQKTYKNSISKPAIELKLFTISKAYEFGIKRKISLYVSSVIGTPVTYGFWKPVILLPIALVNQLSLKEVESLIIHELAHIKQHDYLYNFLILFANNLFFFNPFFGMLCNRLRLEREKVCDMHVIQFKYSAIDYAETLLKTALFKNGRHPLYMAATGHKMELLKRINYFTDKKNIVFKTERKAVLSLSAMLSILILNACLAVFFVVNSKREVSINTDPITSSIISPVSREFVSSIPENTPVEKNVQSSDLQINNENQKRQNREKVKQLQVLVDANEVAVENKFAIQAAELVSDEKELIIKEENSQTGETTTNVFKVRFENGEWKRKLLFTITEGRQKPDSIFMMKDSINVDSQKVTGNLPMQ